MELLQRNGYKLHHARQIFRFGCTQFISVSLKQYIETNQNNLYEDKQLRLMIENPDKQVVGIIDLCNFDPFHHRAEVGIVIAAPPGRWPCISP